MTERKKLITSRDQMDVKIENAIKANGQDNIHVIYSASDTDEDDEHIDNLDEIAVRGKVILLHEADEFWGGKSSKDYHSPILKSPTWLEVTVHANRMIQETNDTHHVFLEGLEFIRRKNNVKEYRFSMGS